MKKLLFAIAGAASFAALAADPTTGRTGDISWVGFENYTVDQTVVGDGDDGNSGGTLWSYTGEQGGDASLVKTYGGDNATAPTGISFPAPFEGAGDNYLALDTNGAELQRAIPAAGQAIAADGTYIDTLVQFTPSESAPTETDLNGAKLAIWLGVDSENNTTNLMVQGAYYTQENAADPTTFNFAGTKAYKLSGTYQPGTWYRLTVKAYSSLINGFTGQYLPGFVIAVDGQTLASDESATDANAYSFLTSPMDMGMDELVTPVTGDNKSLLDNNQFIPSLSVTSMENAPTLTSVGFKGTGALDDFVVTTEAPDFTPAAIDFSLTWPAGLTAVSYQIGEGEPVAISGDSPFAVPGLAAGDVVKFIVANADGAQKTLTGTAGTDTGLDATNETFGWPEYLGAAVDGAYEIDDADELVLFQKGVAAGLTTASTTFKLTDDVTLTAPWPGVGIQNGKDLANGTNETHFVDKATHIAEYDAGAFKGTFDGQNHTISGFQMQGGNLDYCGFFNSIKDATIQNLKIAYKENKFATDSSSSTSESGATFVGVAKSSTLQNLTTVAGSVPDVTCAKGFGGIVGYHMAGTTVESCTNNINLTSAKTNKAGGISMITQNGTGSAIVRNCQNNGTTAGNANQKGGIVGYVGVATTIENCEDTAGSTPSILHNQGQTVTISGVNKAPAGVASYTTSNNNPIDGLDFATVDGTVATFVKSADMELSGTYKVMGPKAAYEFAAAGSITFDESLATPTVTAATGFKVTSAGEGTVTYTAAAAGDDDYKVVIEGSDVVITPTAEDLATIEPYLPEGVETNDVEAVNVLLAQDIGTTGVKVWQAAFLGLAPTAEGLDAFKIDSITIGADGKVTVEMADGVTPKTGRGVDITLKLMASDDLAFTNPTAVATATAASNFEFSAVTPASGETKKFYKVVVEFAGSQN